MKSTNRLFWLCASITLLNALTSAGFSMAAVLAERTGPVNAMYGASRSLTLALVTLVVIGLRSQPGLLVMALVMVGVQAGDAVIGVLIQDPLKTYGPAFLAALTLASLVALFRSAPSPGGID